MGDLIQLSSYEKAPKFPSVEDECCIPINQRSCLDCKHALFGTSGTYCRLYHLDVWNEEQEAEGCEDFEP